MSNSQQVLVLGASGSVDASEALQSITTRHLIAADLQPSRPVVVEPLDGRDLPRVSIDLTGCSFDSLDAVSNIDIDDAFTDRFDTVHANPGVVRSFSIQADPVHVFGADVLLDVALQQIPIVWVEDVDGRLGLTVDEERRDSGLAGTAMISVGQADAVDALQKFADVMLAEGGTPFKVDVQQLRFTQVDGRSVRAEAIAKVSKGFLGARATGSATLSVDDSLTLHVRDLELSSRNPIILAGLKVAQSKVEIDPVDLSAFEIAGARLRDVAVIADDRLSIRAVLG